MALPTALESHRFELFYGSLVLCGLAMAGGQLPALLAASGPTDISPIPALLVVGGLGLAVTSAWEALHRDRDKWRAEMGEGLATWVVIGSGALVAGIAIYWLLQL